MKSTELLRQRDAVKLQLKIVTRNRHVSDSQIQDIYPHCVDLVSPSADHGFECSEEQLGHLATIFESNPGCCLIDTAKLAAPSLAQPVALTAAELKLPPIERLQVLYRRRAEAEAEATIG